MKDVRHKTILGTFFHAPAIGSIEILEDALIGIDGAGRIASVLRADDPRHSVALGEAEAAGRLVRLPTDIFLLPGFVDLHIHAPQYPQLGTALHVPLEVWLQTHTFPLEARYADLAFAERAYSALVGDLLALGTTTALFFATIHQEATRLLADICLAQRHARAHRQGGDGRPGELPGLLPGCLRRRSDRGDDGTSSNMCADTRQTATVSCFPAITPRFIPSCTDPLLEGLGALAQSCGCHVQTHCSESDWEHGAVLARYGRSDAESLDGFGLMTRRTVLAHANFVSDGDMDLIGGRGAGIAHCPLSNVYFSNAVFPLRRALEKGLHVGLGTDISGGPSASLLDNCRMAIAASRMLEDGVDARAAARAGAAARARASTGRPRSISPPPAARKRSTCRSAASSRDAISTRSSSTPRRRDGTIRLFDDDLEAVLQKIIYTASRAEHRRRLGRRPARGRRGSVVRRDAGHDDEAVDAAEAPHPAAERRILVVLDAEVAAERDRGEEDKVGKCRVVADEPGRALVLAPGHVVVHDAEGLARRLLHGRVVGREIEHVVETRRRRRRQLAGREEEPHHHLAERGRIARQPAAASVICLREVGKDRLRIAENQIAVDEHRQLAERIELAERRLAMLEAGEEVHRHPRVVELEEGEEQADLVAARRQLEVVEGDRRRGGISEALAPSAVPNLSPFSLSQRR